MQIRWWMVSASVIGVLMLMLGIGNLLDPGDTGPLFGQVMLLTVMATGAALILTGLVFVRRTGGVGTKLVALGVLPGSAGLAFFWFPPAVAVGMLALVTSWSAFRVVDAPERRAVAS